jgi:hypothetical protein
MKPMRSTSEDRVRAARAGEWWVADEEPEVLSADRADGHLLPRWARQRAMMLLGLAAAALCSAVLL